MVNVPKVAAAAGATTTAATTFLELLLKRMPV